MLATGGEHLCEIIIQSDAIEMRPIVAHVVRRLNSLSHFVFLRRILGLLHSRERMTLLDFRFTQPAPQIFVQLLSAAAIIMTTASSMKQNVRR